MRIGYLHTHPVQYCTPLFRELSAQPGVDLRVYYCHQATASEQAAAGFGVDFDWDVSLLGGYNHLFLRNSARHPGSSTFSGMDVPDIRDQIVKDEIDALIIHGWHFKAAFQAMFACWREGVPYLLRSDSQLGTARSSAKLAIKSLLYPQFIGRAGGCLPVGQLSNEYFLSYGAKPENIFVVPHCVDDQRLTKDVCRLAPERHEIRTHWGIERDQIAWTFAGKFIQKKRPMDFVKTIEHLHRVHLNCIGLMIGDGPLRRECEEYSRDRGVPVVFAGFLNQSEIAKGYVAGDALVLPSSAEETWGLVVNEAMLCGMPGFVSDQVGCGPDLVEKGKTGAVFPFAAPEDCARILAQFAALPVLQSMGQIALERSSRFSIATVAARLNEAASTVVKRHGSESTIDAGIDKRRLAGSEPESFSSHVQQ